MIMMMMTEMMAAPGQVAALRACQAAHGVPEPIRAVLAYLSPQCGGIAMSMGQPDPGSNPAMLRSLGTCVLLSEPPFLSVGAMETEYV